MMRRIPRTHQRATKVYVRKELLRVHTVAPSTAPGVDGFRLGAIVESPSPTVNNSNG